MANQSYKELAAKILKLIGGKENISFFTHCVTRLRFNLKDQSLAKEEEIGRLEGVLGTKIQNGQFQVIIGNKVNEVYAAFCEISGLEKQEGIDENLDKVTAEKKKFSLGMLLEVISGCFAPVIPAFAGAGVLKGILTLVTTYGWMSGESGLYVMLNAASDAVFYFLPFILAFTSAKKFKVNEVLALVIAGIYMYPSILNNAGSTINVLGIDVSLIKYASTALPVLISVWVMGYIHRWLEKHIPSCLRVVLVSAILLLIMAPLNLIVIGPLGNNIAVLIGKAFQWLFDKAPVVGGFVDGFTRPLLVFTSTHVTLGPIMINNIQTLGYDMLSPVHCVQAMAAAGMCFGAFLKAKKEDNKAANFSAFISAFIGITEPALYGVAFRFKKPLLALMIGGGVAGGFVAALGAKAISFAMPALISLPIYVGSIPTVLAGLVIAFVLTAVLTYVLGFDENIEKDQKAIDAEKKNVI